MSLNTGIDFHLKFENDWNDSAGNISDGVPNGAGFVIDDPIGIYSGIWDGFNDRTIWADEPKLNPGLNDFTYATIVKFSLIDSAQHFMDKGFGTSERIRFGILSSGRIFATIGSVFYQSTITLTDTTNFHLVSVNVDRNSANSFFQIDSTFETFDPSGTSGVDLTTINDMAVGARDDGGQNYLDARLSQLTKWGRFLSQAEGLEYYNSGSFFDLLSEVVVFRRRMEEY